MGELYKCPASLEDALTWAEVDFQPERASGITRCFGHEDKTPSLSYNLAKQLWKCHSCGCGGDAMTMIMQKGGVDFVGAKRLAASIAGSSGIQRDGPSPLPGGRYSSRSGVAKGSRDRPRTGGFTPRWRSD